MAPGLAAILARPIAHRGLHDARAGIIENSVAAAQAAIAAGYGIECDVELSRDGEAMVFHDETLDRLTRDTGAVAARTAADLSATALRGSRDQIPALPLFLEEVAGRTPLVIEIKSAGGGNPLLTARTVALVSAYRGPVAIKSFDPGVIANCRALGAACPLGLVGPLEPGLAPPGTGTYDFLSWNIEELASWRDRDSAATRVSRALMTWTVRTRLQHETAEAKGAQIVFESYDPHVRKDALGI